MSAWRFALLLVAGVVLGVALAALGLKALAVAGGGGVMRKRAGDSLAELLVGRR